MAPPGAAKPVSNRLSFGGFRFRYRLHEGVPEVQLPVADAMKPRPIPIERADEAATAHRARLPLAAGESLAHRVKGRSTNLVARSSRSG